MLADVAKARSAQKGIGNCMQNHVGVAMPGESSLVRDRNTAEHNRSFAREGVDIEAHSGARTQAAGEPLLGAVEISRDSEFLQRRIALYGRDLHPGRAHDGGFIARRWP